jgi:hypothetical protein
VSSNSGADLRCRSVEQLRKQEEAHPPRPGVSRTPRAGNGHTGDAAAVPLRSRRDAECADDHTDRSVGGPGFAT